MSPLLDARTLPPTLDILIDRLEALGLTVFVKTPAPKRATRQSPISLGIVHATRGNASMAAQYGATISWFMAGNAMADAVVHHHLPYVTLFGDPILTHATWSAGYGDGGASVEYGADTVGFAVEIPQPANQPFYTNEAIRNAGKVFGAVAHLFDLPASRIASWDQLLTGPVPQGFIGHEDLSAGVKWQKSDPGPRFPWPWFIQRVATHKRALDTQFPPAGASAPTGGTTGLPVALAEIETRLRNVEADQRTGLQGLAALRNHLRVSP